MLPFIEVPLDFKHAVPVYPGQGAFTYYVINILVLLTLLSKSNVILAQPPLFSE